jgi:hypothetical protein
MPDQEIDGYMADFGDIMNTPDNAVVLLTFDVHHTPAQPLGKYGEQPDPRAVRYILGRHPDWKGHIDTIIKEGVSAAVPQGLWDTYHEWGNSPENNFNYCLEDVAREKYGQGLREIVRWPHGDETEFQNDRWHEVNGSNECCGLTRSEIRLSGAELKELARLAQQRAQMSESEEAEPCG